MIDSYKVKTLEVAYQPSQDMGCGASTAAPGEVGPRPAKVEEKKPAKVEEKKPAKVEEKNKRYNTLRAPAVS
jgi:hypothetical protein